MADFINTIEALGDDAVMDALISRTITDFKDDTVKMIGGYAFTDCTALVNVDIPAVTELRERAFKNCSALLHVNLPEVVNRQGYETFSSCTSIERIRFPKLITSNGYYAFSSTTNLKIIDFDVLTKFQFQSAFQYGSSCVAIVLRTRETVCALPDVGFISQAAAFKADGSGNGHIYVPKTMADGTDGIAAYEAATNWSTYAGHFCYIEDYTVDGTLTGEIDETKI